jgi:hypothetical protein
VKLEAVLERARLKRPRKKLLRVEHSTRRLKPLLKLLDFCGATGSRALSKPQQIEFFAIHEAVPFPKRFME